MSFPPPAQSEYSGVKAAVVTSGGETSVCGAKFKAEYGKPTSSAV